MLKFNSIGQIEKERVPFVDAVSAQVAAWGNKDGKFKFGAWIDNVYETEDATK